jgi:cyclic beta-1,2-glucan synthetase
MYRAGLESLLGFDLRGERLSFNPCIPRHWPEYEMTYRRGKTSYRIIVENPAGVSRGVAVVELDGALQKEFEIKLIDDGRPHAVRVVLGSLEGKSGAGDERTARQEAESPTLAAQEESV